MAPKKSTRSIPENPVDPAIAQILDLLRQQTANLTHQQQQLQQQQPQPAIQTVSFKSFQAVNPPEFKGTSDPVVAQAWLKEMEKAFDLVGVEDDQKCKFASYYLKSEANYWWESVEPLEEVEGLTWDRFKELFLEKYFPRYMQSQMELKFFELRQENSSVMEYERKFTELARFVPEYVNTNEKRAKRFQQGLRPWIRSKVAVFELSTYVVVVQKAMIIEGESEQYNKERDSKKRKAESHGGSSGQGSSQGQFNKRPGFQQGRNTGFRRPEGGQGKQGNQQQNNNQQRQQRPPLPDCKTCGKKHSGVCNKANIVCFKCNQRGHYANECKNQRPPILCNRCGKPGHIAKNCRTGMSATATNNLMRITAPNQSADMLRIEGPSAESNPRARTFNMTMRDAVQNSDVVAGTLSMNSVPAKVLIDSGATRSFISREFSQLLNCPSCLLKEVLVIETANQDRTPVDQVCPDCEIEILGHRFRANLIPFKLGEFDVILGMDWLPEHDAQIDCRKKKVTLRISEDKKVEFQGQKQVKKFLTMIQAKRLLRQGCEAYLAHVVDLDKKMPKIEDVPVVNEFPDVFPDELPGLPPDREIEIAIDLAPGTEPVSRAPYRMAPVEMKELATQLQDLLEKGVIRPSVSLLPSRFDNCRRGGGGGGVEYNCADKSN